MCALFGATGEQEETKGVALDDAFQVCSSAIHGLIDQVLGFPPGPSPDAITDHPSPSICFTHFDVLFRAAGYWCHAL